MSPQVQWSSTAAESDSHIPSMLQRLATERKLIHPVSQHRLSSTEKIRQAALLACCDPLRKECSRLWILSGRQWQHLLKWLDTSGLALYFLDGISRKDLSRMLPPSVLSRLEQNLRDNTDRTAFMFAECAAIYDDFRRAGIPCAVLKGFSLFPHSVPRLELRSQLDLDFLISKRHATEARLIIERRGYRLHAANSTTLEFKGAVDAAGASLRDIYRPTPFQRVELHLEMPAPERPSLLAQTEKCSVNGVRISVLAPVHLFLGQGLHVYKHVCSDFSRTAHLLEFRRHVITRREDRAFWGELRSVAERTPDAPLAIGIVLELATQMMGNFAPKALSTWTIDALPAGVQLWIAMYGPRAVLASFPGTKLSLLLVAECQLSDYSRQRSVRQTLLPLRFPPAIAQPPVNEAPSARVLRYCKQGRFILFRLRFHLVEGLRYLVAWLRWRYRRRGTGLINPMH